MDKIPLESPPDASPEITLLLASIGSALRELENARWANDAPTAVRSLESALHTYGSVKHLLPKLNLDPEQRNVVGRQLSLLREQIVTR